jgi:hypothetical protein
MNGHSLQFTVTAAAATREARAAQQNRLPKYSRPFQHQPTTKTEVIN